MSEENSKSPPKQSVASGQKANPRNFRPANAGEPQAEKSVKQPPAGKSKAKAKPAAPNKQKSGQANDTKTSAKPGADQGDTRGLGAVVVRNEFYRDGYRNMLRVVVAQSFIILFMICVMFYVVHIHQPENRYFATTEDGRLVPMVAMSQANLSKPALMSWVAQAVTETMTFNFNDYRRRLQESSRNFTKQGWESFTSALDRSGILDSVKANKQVLTSIPSGAPVLQKEGIDNQGRYYWQVQIPITITYEAGSRTRSDNIVVSLNIVRVPRLESQYGIGIEQWIASE